MTTQSDLKKLIRARQAKTGESYTTARAHILQARVPTASDPDTLPSRVTAVVLKCNTTSLRVRVLGAEDSLTVRCSGYEALTTAPGQLAEITLKKRWTWRDDAYASGTIERAWTDIPALGLEPLPLEGGEVEDISRTYDPFEPPDPYAPMWAFLASSPRESYEFDGIAWGAGVGVDPDDHDAHLISDAAEISRFDPRRAHELLMRAVLADMRCIDAHVHLGNLCFDRRPEQALVHYDVAIAIGELSLGPDFNGMLPWGRLYNRPFLRALHGQALCVWRLGDPARARRIFERMFALNPADHQGARFCWDDIRNGLPWRPDGHDDGDTLPAGFR